jgi:hypothetical protein
VGVVRGLLDQSFPTASSVTVRQHRIFTALVLAGVLVRIGAALFTTNSQDVALFGYIATQGAQGHTLYGDPEFSYPPLVGFIMLAAGKLLAILGLPIVVHAAPLSPFAVPGLVTADLATPFASLLIKLPAMLGDAALALAVDRACRLAGARETARRIAVIFVWLNPLIIFDSSVQASWDCIVPLSIIAAGMAALDGEGSASGAWIAIGALAKIVPVTFIPLAAAALWRAGSGVWRLASAIGAGAIVAAVALGPIAASGELPALRDLVAGRSAAAGFGGFNAWTSLHAYVFAQAAAWMAIHGPTVATVASVVQFVAVVVTAVALLRVTPLTIERFVIAATAVLAVILVTAPYVQPGYVVWLAPFCAILGACGKPRWNALLWLASGCALAFMLTVRAPAALAVPACWFFHLCDPLAFVRAGYAYAYESGTLTPLAQVDNGMIVGIAGTFVFLLVVWCALAEWRKANA